MINIGGHRTTAAAMRTHLVRKWHLRGHLWHKLSSLKRHNFRTPPCRTMYCTAFEGYWDGLHFCGDRCAHTCLLSMPTTLEASKRQMTAFPFIYSTVNYAALKWLLQSIVIHGKFWKKWRTHVYGKSFADKMLLPLETTKSKVYHRGSVGPWVILRGHKLMRSIDVLMYSIFQLLQRSGMDDIFIHCNVFCIFELAAIRIFL